MTRTSPPTRPSGAPRAVVQARLLRFAPSLVVVAIVVAACGVAWAFARANVERNERALLDARANDTATIIDRLWTSARTTLRNAQLAADVADARGPRFGDLVEPQLLTGPVAAVALVDLAGSAPRILGAAGAAPLLAPSIGPVDRLALALAGPPGKPAFFAARTVAGVRLIGYGMRTERPDVWVIGEIQTDEAIARLFPSADDLQGAYHLGGSPTAENLIASNVPGGVLASPSVERRLMLDGVPTTLVVASPRPLVTGVAAAAPALVLLVGLVVSTALVLVIEVLRRRRDEALARVAALRSANAELARAGDELQHLALHDPLTGLGNRALLARAVAAAAGSAQTVGLLLVDLDDFKTINDSLGHEAGDALLVAAGLRLRSSVPRGATCCRLGGDEFAVVLPGHDEDAAACVGLDLLDALGAPLSIAGAETRVVASVGVAVAAPGAADGDDLLRRADLAMYAAKRGERSPRLGRFEPPMLEAVRHRLAAKADLERAIEHDELFVEYQPIVRLEDGAISSAEALVRWRHPQRGLVPPGAFIELAEETGAIVAVGRLVLRAVCADLGELRRIDPAITVAVNISGRQLHDGAFPAELRACVQHAGLPPAALTLEITESLALDDLTAASAVRELHAAGFRIALDDFGAGYSSLSNLRANPFDILKIDRSFVQSLATGRSDPFLDAVAQLARGLELVTVAEGVETREQAERVRDAGISHAQGYLYARPASVATLAALLDRQGRRSA